MDSLASRRSVWTGDPSEDEVAELVTDVSHHPNLAEWRNRSGA